MRENKKYFWLLIALCMVCSPSIFTVFSDFFLCSLRENSGKVLLACYNAALVLLPLVLFRVRVRLYLLFFVAFVFFAPLAIAYYHIYKNMPPQWIVMSLLDTNFYEITELIAGNEWLVLVFLGNLGVYIYILFGLLPHNFYLNAFKWRLSVGLFVGLYTIKTIFFSQTPILENIAETYPCGGVQNITLSVRQYAAVSAQTRQARSTKFGAKKRAARPSSEVYILIVGEAARYDYWQINGFAEATSPLLSARKNLVSFGDVSTQAGVTYTSQPMMLTQTLPQNFDSVYLQKTFTSAFNEAGFETYWIFNDLKGSSTPSNALFFAKEAKNFISAQGILSAEQNYDGKMLPIIDSVLKIKKPKKLLVIFTAGSHHNFCLRYPKEFDVFRPSDFGKNLSFSAENKNLKLNSYKNSILYTDYFIDKTIAAAEKTQAAVALLYAPDHGENLRDNNQNLISHGSNNRYVLHIPLFIWYSDAYKKTYAEKASALHQNQPKAASTHNIFYTLIDLADITYPSFNQNLSLASPNFTPITPRKVLQTNGSITNYEDAN